MSDQNTSRNSKAAILALTCAAQFMVVLDIAIVNVALPSIQQDLGVGESTLQWVVIAYGLLLGGCLLLGGRMADLLGRRRILVTGLTIFSTAAFVAGISRSSGLLITARGSKVSAPPSSCRPPCPSWPSPSPRAR